MSYRNKTYIAFDGGNDIHYFRLMQAWKSHDHIDFDFYDAHDLNSARDTSTDESIKSQLRIRMANAKQMVLLVGKNTKYRTFVPWEVQLARKKDIPIIVVNLNKQRSYDNDYCPSWVVNGDERTVHISFDMKIIKYALDYFPNEYAENKGIGGSKRNYGVDTYNKLGL